MNPGLTGLLNAIGQDPGNNYLGERLWPSYAKQLRRVARSTKATQMAKEKKMPPVAQNPMHGTIESSNRPGIPGGP